MCIEQIVDRDILSEMESAAGIFQFEIKDVDDEKSKCHYGRIYECYLESMLFKLSLL